MPKAQTEIRHLIQTQGWFKRRARGFFLFVCVPAWLGPGLLDWLCHRRSHIEDPNNGGLQESLLHVTMFSEAGIPLVLSLFFEMNPLLLTLMSGSAVVHEITAVADVRLALESRRNVSQTEQHIHSFLEVMPFWIVPLLLLLHQPSTDRWKLTRRHSALSSRDLAYLTAGICALGVLPYAEELGRCWRSRKASGGHS